MSTTGNKAGNDLRRKELIRTFCRKEQWLAAGAVGVGIAFMATGTICVFTQWHDYSSAGLPLIVSGIIILWLGSRLWSRSHGVLRNLKITSVPEAFIRTYQTRSEHFISSINRTRNISAFVLAMAVIGLVTACISERFSYTIWGWIVLLVSGALFSLVAYVHVFHLEIHLHELTRNPASGDHESTI